MSNKINHWQYLLDNLRKRRGFDVAEYSKLKVQAINDFFRTEKLDAAVVGLSGGIDSTIALRLLLEAREQEDSPIKRIVGITIPFYTRGATNQSDVVQRVKKVHAELVKQNLPFELQVFEDYTTLIETISTTMPSGDWAVGQLLSALRTPIFYFEAARLQEQRYRSIVVGTINRDEGGYVGFFGKGSDAMVDLQIISDLHKSEVYKLADHFNVSQEIRSAVPRGDVWDGKTDSEMIGAPYDFVEYVNLCLEYYKTTPKPQDASAIIYLDNIEKIHKLNNHKYNVGMPARFVDVMSRKVPGGWQ